MELDYQRVDKDGNRLPSRRSQLMQALETAGAQPNSVLAVAKIKESLEEPPIPLVGEPVWDRFWEMGVSEEFSATELEAWSRLMGIAFDPWEVLALRRMHGTAKAKILELMNKKDGT